MTKPLAFITGNRTKLKEVKCVLDHEQKDVKPGERRIELINEKIDLPEIQGTPEEVVIAKAQDAAKAYKGPVVVDDTSLCLTAFKGMPGPYIKDFINNSGVTAISRMLDGFDDRSAVALASYAYCGGPGEEVKVFVGKLSGTIAKEPSVLKGYGFYPVFIPDGMTETISEIGDTETIVSFSHRGNAVRSLLKYLKSL
ncbi:Ham1-like protein like protein [Aduncisulcus paluster]|uniref:Ham1-like protein like protein n=1 Tax=Aduncisulcus paluster TaxID=2918883 RepID=A0ABQ5JTT5_9EUKA|nr:Ham1-like protein like protein [Aduncisulcus paluster]